MTVLPLLFIAAFLAGFVDAVVGGGGLISMPALMLGLPPTTALPVILGINKFQAATGTTFAAAKFLRSGTLHVREMVWPVLGAMVGASGGVALAYRLKGDFLRPFLLLLMVAMLAWTLFKPDQGRLHAPKYALSHQRGLAILISVILGFYDGFFGPGTGSLLIFLFVAILGFDFLRASALAKSVNWASNMAALALFLWHGSWLPGVALVMAVGNGIGGYLGAHLALEKGSRFVRGFFICVVSALILRLGWQLLRN